MPEERILVIGIRTCFECPFLRYFSNNNCSAPAEYCCDNPSLRDYRITSYTARRISYDHDNFDGKIPDFCPITPAVEPFKIAGYKNWER